MTSESMTPNERLWAAMRLEKPDRVPVVPTMTPESDGGLLGISMAEVQSSNDIALEACLRVFDEFGGWDSVIDFPYTVPHRHALQINPMKTRIPGRDLPDDYMAQLVEEEVMKFEDYDTICEKGFNSFYYEDYLWRITDMRPEDLPRTVQEAIDVSSRLTQELAKRGVKPFIMQVGCMHPVFLLSQIRSLTAFTRDMYFHPDTVERTIRRMTDDVLQLMIPRARELGAKAGSFVEERASAFYYPLPAFERFWWPYFEEITDAFWSEGVVSIWHLDTCWNKNLPYFKRVPRGSLVLEFDGTTDIFLAKEILRDHQCIYGDVPASLLTVGSPQDVEAYCKKLIDAIGGDGGFILGSGCCVPPTCTRDNFRAMIETAKTYELSKN